MQIPVRLESHPEFGRGLQQPRQSQRRIGRDPAFAEHDFVEAVDGNPKLFGGLPLAESEGLEELLEQHLTGPDRRSGPVGIPSDGSRF